MKVKYKVLFIVTFIVQLTSCAIYYNPLGGISFLPSISSKVKMEQLLDIITPILFQRKCKLMDRNASMHPAGFSFLYKYNCGDNIYVSFFNEGINFNYLAGGDSIESKPRPEKKVWHGLFVSIQTKLDESWDGIIKIEESKQDNK